jgi:hypothetical protein
MRQAIVTWRPEPNGEVVILRSKLYWCVTSDQYCVICVRGVSTDEVIARLGVVGQEPHPRFTPDEAVRQGAVGIPALRIHAAGDWTLLFEVDPNGTDEAFQAGMLSRLSVGTEVVCAQQLMAGTAKVTHVRDGVILATYVDWHFTPATGADPGRLNEALRDAGFFSEENAELDEWNPAEMVLLAVERAFGIEVSPDAVNGALPTVMVAGWTAPQVPPQLKQRKPGVTPQRQRRQAERQPPRA